MRNIIAHQNSMRAFNGGQFRKNNRFIFVYKFCDKKLVQRSHSQSLIYRPEDTDFIKRDSCELALCVRLQPVRPDWAIYWTFGNFSKTLAAINLPKSPTFLGNICKNVQIFNFSSEIIFGPTFIDIWWLFTGHTGCNRQLCFHSDRKLTTFLLRNIQIQLLWMSIKGQYPCTADSCLSGLDSFGLFTLKLTTDLLVWLNP